MTKITITLPETFAFIRAEQTFTVNTGNFNEDIIAQLVMHGATQKIGDAAAGKSGADAMTAMQAVYETLSNGDWGRTRGGSGEEPWMRYAREFIRENLGADNKAKYAELKGDSDARADFLNGLYDAQSDAGKETIRTEAEARLEADRKRKADAKARAAKLGLSI